MKKDKKEEELWQGADEYTILFTDTWKENGKNGGKDESMEARKN